MTAICSHAVPTEDWIDFFGGELDDEAGARLERRLFKCPACATEAERWGAVAGGAGVAIPPVISIEALRALQDRGERMNENPMQPGQHRRADFPDDGRLLIHRLRGLDLTQADRVDLTLSTPGGTLLGRLEDVPFDRDSGEVLVACQRHFGKSFPEKIVFEVERRVADEVEMVASYGVDHRY